MSAHSSQASADSTSDSPEPDTGMCSSASPTLTGETCLPPGSPECPSTMTYEVFRLSGDYADPSYIVDDVPMLTANPMSDRLPLIFSVGGSLARTCPSPASAAGSPGTAPASSMSSPGSPGLFDPDGFSSRTYQDCSLQTAVGTSESCLGRWPTSGTAWRGGFSTHVSSECRSADGECSSSEPSLTEILEPPQSVPAKYSLSARAAQGILRRAEKRGRTLPPHLEEALARVAGTTETRSTGGGL